MGRLPSDWSETKGKIRFAIEKIGYIFRRRMKMDYITEGFQNTGQYKSINGEFNFMMCMAQKRGTTLTIPELIRLKQRAEDVDIQLMRESGQLTEKQLDDSNVMGSDFADSSSVTHEMRALFKRRAVLITHPEIMPLYTLPPSLIDPNRSKVETKELLKAVNKVKAATKRKQADELETARIEAMSEEELAAHNAAFKKKKVDMQSKKDATQKKNKELQERALVAMRANTTL